MTVLKSIPFSELTHPPSQKRYEELERYRDTCIRLAEIYNTEINTIWIQLKEDISKIDTTSGIIKIDWKTQTIDILSENKKGELEK